jgi:uncharacterized membrane protein
MPDFEITYYNLSDGQVTATVNAPDEETAIKYLTDTPYSTFAQLKEIVQMTTPTTTPAQQAARDEAAQFRADLRADLAEIMDELHSQRAELVNVRADLEAIRAGLTQASQPARGNATFGEMEITAILKSIDKQNKINYTATGTPYSKWGVRVWDEILPALGIDPDTLEFGNNTITPAIRARVLLGETKNRETGKVVTGKA